MAKIGCNWRLPVEDYAYAAGLIDGEGCIGIHNKRCDLRITVQMADPQAVKWLCETFGSKFRKYKWARRPGARALYFWTITGRRAFVFLLNIVDYLKVKKEQALLGIAFWNAHPRKPGVHPVPDNIQKSREDFKAKMCRLNQRGVT